MPCPVCGNRCAFAGGGPVAPVVAPAEGKEGKDDDTDDAGGKEGGGKPRDEHGGGSFNIDVNASELFPSTRAVIFKTLHCSRNLHSGYCKAYTVLHHMAHHLFVAEDDSGESTVVAASKDSGKCEGKDEGKDEGDGGGKDMGGGVATTPTWLRCTRR